MSQAFQTEKFLKKVTKRVSSPLTNGWGDIYVAAVEDSPRYYLCLEDTALKNMFTHTLEVSERFALTWFTEFGDEV